MIFIHSRRDGCGMRELILNADDFGYTRGINEGILRAHREGVLTSATLMANGAAFDDAVSGAKSCPDLGIGCHLVLIGGLSVAPAAEIPSLVDAGGRLPDSLTVFVTRLSAGLIRVRDVELEFRAQIQKIRAAGIEPSHLDTHKHTHAHPRVMGAVCRVAQELGISRVRKPFENLRDSWDSSRARSSFFSQQLMAVAAARLAAPRFDALVRRHGLRAPDNFLGVASTGKMGAAALAQLIDALPDGRTEIMLHPGIYDADLAATGSRLGRERQLELDALLDAGVKRAVLEKEVRLITFRELN
jgi:hopanoid biosynthesis associated protein HpnK